MVPKNWKLDHDPEARPLGCNGRYGESGRKAHKKAGTVPCDACRASSNHYARELRRGQPNPTPLHPCGTAAAARRHRYKGELVDIACADAEAKYHAENRAKHRMELAA